MGLIGLGEPDEGETGFWLLPMAPPPALFSISKIL
jgi:hypothetical protein